MHRPAPRSSGPGMLLLGVLALPALLAAPAQGTLTIHCIDVGQGDATLIRSSSGQTLLFDGGDNGKGNSVVNPYLASLGIAELTYMAASHYHADHLGGLDEVYNGTGVALACYDRGWGYTTQTYQTYAATVASLRQVVTDGQVIDLGEGVSVRCVTLNGNGVVVSPFSQPPHDENDLCIGLVVSCGAFDFLVAGDLGGTNSGGYADIETSLGPEVGEIEVYRVDHHGSRYSSNASYLSALSPEVAVISVGTNSYGHPHQEVINRLVAAGSYIYQTEAGSGGTIPSGSGRVVGSHVVIETDGYTAYTVAGDVYALSAMSVDVPPASGPGAVLLEVGPNPFRLATTVRYRLPGSVQAGQLALFDIHGRQVRSWRVAGSGELPWDGRDVAGGELAAGVYFLRLNGADSRGSQRVVLIR